MATIQPVKGTRDFYPDKTTFRNFLTDHMRQTANLFGYEEFDGPILEPFELYAAKSGDELVNQQSFVFEDRGGRQIVLRPELTPSLARMVAERQQSLPKPIKWFSVGPMWRYEQPQKGRAREFLQWNVDCLGSDAMTADAEAINVAINFLVSLGLTEQDVVIKINDRQWFEQTLLSGGITKDKIAIALKVVDRADKMPSDAWHKYATEALNTGADQILERMLSDTSGVKSQCYQQIHAILASVGLSKFIAFDPTVVRGLDYYTGMVFEVKDRLGQLRSIGGGGRYANLVEQVGGQPLPGVGFALGDMPIEELLRQVNKIPIDKPSTATVLVTVAAQETYDKSLTVAATLRTKNIPTETYLQDFSKPIDIDRQIKYAKQKAIPFVILFTDEATDNLTLMSIKTGDKQQGAIDKIVASLSVSKINPLAPST